MPGNRLVFPGVQGYGTSGGPVLGGEESGREERCRLWEGYEAQRPRIPGCNAIRHPGGLHAQISVLAWSLHLLCPLPGTPFLQTSTGLLSLPNQLSAPNSLYQRGLSWLLYLKEHHQPIYPTPNIYSPSCLVPPHNTCHLSHLLDNKSLLNVIDKFLETATWSKTVYIETAFTLS